jgi:hypothetical protein
MNTAVRAQSRYPSGVGHSSQMMSMIFCCRFSLMCSSLVSVVPRYSILRRSLPRSDRPGSRRKVEFSNL